MTLLAKKVQTPNGDSYPKLLDTPAKRALYDNLGKNEELALAVYAAVETSRQDDFRGNSKKLKLVRFAIKAILKDEQLTEQILELVINQSEF